LRFLVLPLSINGFGKRTTDAFAGVQNATQSAKISKEASAAATDRFEDKD
jgi:hypothetical protein